MRGRKEISNCLFVKEKEKLFILLENYYFIG